MGSKYFTGLITGFLLAMLVLRIIPTLTSVPTVAQTAASIPSTTPSTQPVNQQEITQKILPNNYNLGVSFKDTVVKMVQYGAIDKQKFLNLYQGRGVLDPAEKQLLDQASDKNIIINTTNAPVLLNLLWPLGITNKSKVLSEGPIGKEYAKDAANLASTGGWTLGAEEGGKLLNRFSLISLSPEQEDEVIEIAKNIYRPCCGNSTYFPDCNHGAAMLSFIELAVSQGMKKEDIYKKAMVLNSYWFPQNYAELSVYFQTKKNISWDKVNPQEILGQDYSSSQGSKNINQQLQSDGLIPKVQGGGGCGV